MATGHLIINVIIAPFPLSLNVKLSSILLSWRREMKTKLCVLDEKYMWYIIEFPVGKTHIGCMWLYKVKYNCNGKIKIHKFTELQKAIPN